MAGVGRLAIVGMTVNRPAPPATQTVSVVASQSNPVAPVVGQAMNYTAIGSPNTNLPFNASVISGSGSLFYDAQSGAVQFTPSQPGAWQVGVWRSAGTSGGFDYSVSNQAIINGSSIIDPTIHRVTLTLDNRARVVPTTFRIWQNGAVLYTVVVPAGDVLIRTFTVPTADPVTVTTLHNGIKKSGDGIWYSVNVDQEYEQQEGGDYMPTTGPTSSPNPAPSNPPVIPNAPADTKPLGDEDSTVWKSQNATSGGNGLDNKTFVEGIDKVTHLLKDKKMKPPTVLDYEPTDVSLIQGMPDSVRGLSGKIPVGPQIQTSSQYSSVFTCPSFQIGSKNYGGATYDLAQHQTAISAFRVITTGVMSILFFFAFVKTLRGAFAS